MEPNWKTKVADIALANAHSSSQGRCAAYVRIAIQQARGEPQVGWNADAEDYGPILLTKGYKVATVQDHTKAKVGTIAVIAGSANHPCGHVAVKTSSGWVSDFKQKNFNIYRDMPNLTYKLYE